MLTQPEVPGNGMLKSGFDQNFGVSEDSVRPRHSEQWQIRTGWNTHWIPGSAGALPGTQDHAPKIL
jgi:hypothetical protein